MPARKTPEPIASNINNNHNTNNITVNVPHHNPASGPKKPNWIVKALVLGIISLILGLIGYYVQDNMGKKTKAPEIHHAPVSGEIAH